MLWIILGSVAVTTAAGLSIAASIHSHRDIETGHPKFDSIADVTGIWDRSTFDQSLGPRDADDRYTVNPEAVYRIPQTLPKRLFDNVCGDVVSIGFALVSPVLFRSQPAVAVILLIIASTYMVVGYVSAIVVVVGSQSSLEDQSPEHQNSQSSGEDVDCE
jgi:flagellar basal body-associated protein FliL